MGAWIETEFVLTQNNVRNVASYMGAWIETLPEGRVFDDAESHPTWVRGLKHSCCFISNNLIRVASYMGAWIETLILQCSYSVRLLVASYMGAWIETI